MMMPMIMMINHDDDNDDIRLFRTCFLGTVEQKVFTHTLVRVPDLFPNLWIHLWWYISIDRFQAQIRVGPMDSPWEKLGGKNTTCCHFQFWKDVSKYFWQVPFCICINCVNVLIFLQQSYISCQNILHTASEVSKYHFYVFFIRCDVKNNKSVLFSVQSHRWTFAQYKTTSLGQPVQFVNIACC